MPLANPDVTASLRAAGVTVGLDVERILVVGQQNGGTAISGALTENILDDKAWDTLYGPDAAISAAIRRIRLVNKQTIVDAIGLDDNGAGVAATGTITITGTATEDGTLIFYVGSKKSNKYTIAVADTDTPTIIGDAIVTAITADANAFVTSANVTGVVTLTAKNAGTFGNTLGIATEGSVGGITSTLAAMTSGATDPVLTGVFDVVGTNRYQGIAWQFQGDLTELTDFLDPRFNVTNNVLDGRGFVGSTDTFANHLTALGTENSQSLSINTDKLITDTARLMGPAVVEVPFVKVSEFVGVRGLRRTDDAVLGDFVIARSPRDAFGGPHTNSKPYFNTPLPNLLVPGTGDSFTEIEVGQLKDARGWVIDSNRQGTEVIAGEVVTTYKTDAAGNPDPTFGFSPPINPTSLNSSLKCSTTFSISTPPLAIIDKTASASGPEGFLSPSLAASLASSLAASISSLLRTPAIFIKPDWINDSI